MIVATTHEIPGHDVSEVLGIVEGNTIRARSVLRDLLAILKNIIGGEIEEYTKLMAESRDQAIDRMIEEAEKLQADAILDMRFSTSEVMSGAAEILAYGTAVKLKKK